MWTLYSARSAGIFRKSVLSGLVTAVLPFSAATHFNIRLLNGPSTTSQTSHRDIIYFTCSQLWFFLHRTTRQALQDYGSLWAGQRKLFTVLLVGVIRLAPRVDRPQGRHGFDHRKPVCLARRTSGSVHARMVIGTSISWLMSAN